MSYFFSNLVSPSEKAEWDVEGLLGLYKSQSGIEQNFGFLKNPVIINSVFLKNNSRIEVLGIVLLISLLIWRLIERSMRLYSIGFIAFNVGVCLRQLF